MENQQSMGDQFLDSIRQIIEDNIGNEDFSVSVLAKEAGLSRSMLYRKLFRLTGKSATDLITEFRLTRAMELLENDVATVSEIAYQIGFTSPSYFNKVFKKAYGMAPGEVRKKGEGRSVRLRVVKSPENQKSARLKKLRWKIAAWTGILVIAGLIVLNIFPRVDRESGAEIPELSIAVLPFRNDSPDQENEYFISGTMECIHDKLCKIEGLTVLSRSSVEQFRSKVVPVSEAANILRVNFLLEGSMQKYGTYARINVQLSNRMGNILWSGQFEGEIEQVADLIAFQSEIALNVADKLHTTITPEEKEIILRAQTSSLKALGLYRKAREEHSRFWLDKNRMESLKLATALYRACLKEDPGYGKAYTGLAMAIKDSYKTESWLNRELPESGDMTYRDSILFLANKALTFDANLEEAYLVRGTYYQEIQQYNRALAEYDRALQINPNYSLAYNARSDVLFYVKSDWIGGLENKLNAVELERGSIQLQLLGELGFLYEHMGFPDKASEVYEERFLLDGDSLRYFMSLGGCCFDRRDWKGRIYWHSKALKIEPDRNRSLVAICDSYFILGNQDSVRYYAFLILENLETSYQFNFSEFYIGMVLLQLGRVEEANRFLDKVENYITSLMDSDESDERDIYLLSLARLYCLRGQADQALHYLNQIDRNSLKPLWYIITLENSECLKNKVDIKDFQLILNSLKAVWQTEHEMVRLWMMANGMLEV